METNSAKYIIAIGASAGGLEELQHFFDYTPLDGAAYIIVQHLSPDFKSRMVELLAKHSKLIVREAEEGVPVEINQVYLIPSKKFMTINDGKLRLTDKKLVAGPHLTIDTLFNSLAEDKGDKAIGVILSGLGGDGTEGAKAIHKQGGIIIAREPTTTGFSAMPLSVIATGIVDYVLEPELMPEAIEHYVKNNGALLPQSVKNKADEKVIGSIIELIKEQVPLDFSDYKQPTILRRIKRRAASHNFSRLEDYLAFCKINNEELEALAKDFLISVTSFFRDKEAYEFLEKNVIPEIIKQNIEGEEIKFWIAGCATGEEAYSMAILLKEQLTGNYRNYAVKIFATDIDTAALAYAGKGRFPASIEKDISPKRLENFFTKDGDFYNVKHSLRKMLIFAKHDLVKNPPYCNMHLISCRNLLIYMNLPLQKKIYNMLLFGLRQDGYLFLGSSENAQPIGPSLELLHKKWKIYKNIRTKRTMYADAFAVPDFAVSKNDIPKLTDDTYNSLSTLTESVSSEIMNDLGYMMACVDDHHQVVKTFGDTSRYLLQKNFNLNLAELLPGRLSLAFKTAATKALNQNDRVIINGIKIKKDKKNISVRLMVKPFSLKTGKRLLMVLLSADAIQRDNSMAGEMYDEKSFLDEYTKNIEEELREAKIELHNTNEKLDASNENLQSYNEELLSANEEMQSTNEEMQSVNEELHTINLDYQLKNKELMVVNDDLNNYFRSNINGQLYVNNDLLLMRFSPGTVKHINLRESDIGRPISNISTNIKFETIEEDIKEVLKSGNTIKKDIESTDGRWYQLMTMPYLHQEDTRIHGAMLTFSDITELKKLQFDLEEKNKNLLNILRINEDLDNFVHAASHDLLGPLTSMQLGVSAMKDFDVTDPSLKALILTVNSSIKKFSELIKDMSVIGKIETGMLEMENVNISDIIEDIKLGMQDTIRKTKTVIKTDLKVKEIYFSKKNFRSILYNLISNAIKFKNKKNAPVILISSESNDHNICITVKDNGIGIPEEGMSNIFNIRGRLHQEIEGQGIGLFLVRK